MAFDKKIYLREWHIKNRDRRRLQVAERFKIHPEKRERKNLLTAIRQKSHMEEARAAQKRWRDKNKAYNALRMGKYRVKRRSMEKAARVNLSSIKRWVNFVRSREVNYCYYCTKVVTLDNLHFDHVIPISKGGQHSVDNLCVSCAHCNKTKNAKLVGDYVCQNQLFLNL